MLDIPKLLEKKRTALPDDSEYIEELERMLFVTDEAFKNIEIENNRLREIITELQMKVKFLNCLEAMGVDNWVGYEEAQEMMEDDYGRI